MSVVKKCMKDQWRKSCAKSIWDDMTPFGRATIWIPIWFLSFLELILFIPFFAVAVFLLWVPIPNIGKLFFKNAKAELKL